MIDGFRIKINAAFLSPILLFSVFIMLLNDHLLKGAHVLPVWLTGKLSDFAFLFFAPIAVGFLLRVRTLAGLFIAHAIPAALFIAINLSIECSSALESALSIIIPARLWQDPEDLIALAMLPISFCFILVNNPKNRISARPRGAVLQTIVLLIVAGTCIATSPARGITHEPVYMSWQDFRSSAKVGGPQPISEKGKILVKDGFLFMSEPNKGIHIIDISNPLSPEPVAFITVHGNLDIAIKGSALYADSFVDMLVFCIAQDPEDSVLVNRIENIFPYDPYQTLADEQAYVSRDIDKNKGIVIDWRQVASRMDRR